MFMAHRKTNTTGISELNALAKLMDAQFRVPGTEIRFGLDALIGFIPGVGDFASFLVSAYIISVARKNGASGFVVSRMVFNAAIDALIGAIPFLGDLFDIGFKANQKNMRLVQQHFNEGRHQGPAGKFVIPMMILLLVVLAACAWLVYRLITWIF